MDAHPQSMSSTIDAAGGTSMAAPNIPKLHPTMAKERISDKAFTRGHPATPNLLEVSSTTRSMACIRIAVHDQAIRIRRQLDEDKLRRDFKVLFDRGNQRVGGISALVKTNVNETLDLQACIHAQVQGVGQ
jgi:hypothetical protein